MEKLKALVRVKQIEGKRVRIVLKALPVQVKVVDEEERIIEAYASVFGNIDSYGEIVDKGAFTEFLAEFAGRFPKAAWCHSWTDILGPVLSAQEDEYGLRVRFKLTKGVQRADEAWLLAKDGALTDMSFGFSTIEAYYDPATGIRHLKRLAVWEVSPVLVGANQLATIQGIKSADQHDGDFLEASEDELKEADEPPATPPAGDPPAGDPPAGDGGGAQAPAGGDPAPEPEPAADHEKARRQAVKDAVAALRAQADALEATLGDEGAHEDPKADPAPAPDPDKGAPAVGQGSRIKGIKLVVPAKNGQEAAVARLLRKAKIVIEH